MSASEFEGIRDNNPEYTHCSVELNPLDEQEVVVLTSCLRGNTHVINLDILGYPTVTEQELRRVIELLGDEVDRFQSVLLNGMHIEVAALDLIPSFVSLKQLKVAARSSVDLCRTLARILSSNPGVSLVDLQGFGLDDDEVVALTQFLVDGSGVKSLCLTTTGIRDTGVGILAHTLARNETLKVLELLHNRDITDAGMEALGHMLSHNRTLECLNVYGCTMSSTGLAHLWSGLRHNLTLKQLHCMEAPDKILTAKVRYLLHLNSQGRIPDAECKAAEEYIRTALICMPEISFGALKRAILSLEPVE